MTISSKVRRVALLAKSPQSVFTRYEKLILISHMRGRTSLLSHLLGSHPEISGYYEQHIAYKKKFAGLRMRSSLLAEGLVSADTRYLFDKVLHQHLDLPAESPAKRLILIREAAPTLKSIVRMGRSRNTKWQDETLATSYYCDRLQQILILAKESDHPIIFMKSEDLITRSESILEKLSEILSLKTLLSDRYESFEKTGSAISGDPSASINAGKIIKTAASSDIQVSIESITRAQDTYDQVTDGLQSISRIRLL